jgi:hypothetical protein
LEAQSKARKRLALREKVRQRPVAVAVVRVHDGQWHVWVPGLPLGTEAVTVTRLAE